jgi:hypothetical protein
MINFVLLTLSIFVAMLLVYGVAAFLFTRKPVVKWYMKKVTKLTNQIVAETLEDEDL